MIVENKYTGKQIGLKQKKTRILRKESKQKLKEAIDFEDLDDTDLEGASCEIAIDDLISEFSPIITKVSNEKGFSRSDIKKVISVLWIEKINDWVKNLKESSSIKNKMKEDSVYQQWKDGKRSMEGSFVTALFKLYDLGSSPNQSKLEKAFPEYFK